MIHYAARRMNVFPLRTFVKVGDTPADIAEALNAGTWAVAVVRTGNEIGLSREEWEALSDEERGRRYEAAANRLRAAGAHFVIDSVEALWPVLEVISERIQSGARP
jgi:phosphonoacetaldehyde hydrolase